jgi:glucose 1-dehydrogenase
MQKFSQQHALVTGAGQGIGYAICAALIQAGATVSLNDLDGRLAQEATARLNEGLAEPMAFPIPGDVADPDFVRQMIQHIRDTQGRLDILVANAGITEYGPFLEVVPAAFDQLTSVNLRGTFFCAQAAARQMIAQQSGGRIILMSSVTGVQAHRNLSAYGMTKAAIRMLARNLALELGEYGITVNALGPGATMTERTQDLDEAYEAGWNRVAPNGRTATVEDIANSCLFLASPEARHITGETLMVDGGWTIYSPLPGESFEP